MKRLIALWWKENKLVILFFLAIVTIIGVIIGTILGVTNYLKGSKTALGWCVDEIKMLNQLKEDDNYAYTYSEVEISETDFTKAYLIDFIYDNDYGTLREEWFAGIAYKIGIKLIKKENIIAIDCDLIKSEYLD